MKKKSIALLLALAVIFSFCVPSAMAAGSMSNFIKVKTYSDNFTDNQSGKWYYKNIKTCYEYNLMNGMSKTTFAPDDNLTLAQAITMASRIHRIYHNGTNDLKNGKPVWYDTYVKYAIDNGIIKSGDFSDYNVSATRAQMAYIFSRALPSGEFQEINSITSIPDVKSSAKYYNEIMLLYKAGVLTGMDKYGTFDPNSNVKRSESAAIISRVAVASLRKSFVMYKTYTATAGSAYAKIDVPAYFVEGEDKGIAYLRDQSSATVVAIDVNEDDVFSNYKITDLFSAAEIEDLYRDNLAQSDNGFTVSQCDAERVDFGNVPGYRCKIVMIKDDVSIYSYTYLFICENGLFEIAYTAGSDSKLLKSLTNDLRVMGNGVSPTV